MDKNLLNEINRNRNIMGLPPIIIEQDELTRKEKRQERRIEKENLKLAQEISSNELYKWDYKLSGPLNWKPEGNKGFRLAGPSDGFLAEEIGFYRDNRGVGKTLGLRGAGYGAKEVPTQEPGTKPTPPTTTSRIQFVTVPGVEVMGSSMPYPDNFVKPYFDIFPDAKITFDKIVRQFKEYIEAGGLSNLNNIEIQGTADSAVPNDKVPKIMRNAGYNKIDHDYGGKTTDEEKNVYLAYKRAEYYAESLINEVKEETGETIKIKVLPGISYLGDDGKRGSEYRKIILTPNAEPIEPNASPIQTQSTISGTDGTDGGVVDNREEFKKIKVEVYYKGKLYEVDGIRWIASGDHKISLIKADEPIVSKLPNGFDITDTAELSPDLDFTVGGTYYGKFSKQRYNAQSYIPGSPDWGYGHLLGVSVVYPDRTGYGGTVVLPTGENGEDETWIAPQNMTYHLKPMNSKHVPLQFPKNVRKHGIKKGDAVYRLENEKISNWGDAHQRLYTDSDIKPNLNL